MTQDPTTNGDDLGVPVCIEGLTECRNSAYFWVNHLPEYADHNQSKADLWSILAGVLAAITSLSIFPLLGQGSGIWDKAIVSAVALASAVSALVPRVKNYGEMAGAARVLAAQYGSVYGRLLDVVAAIQHAANQDAPNQHAANQHAAKVVVAEFDSIKAKKDALRLLGPWTQQRQQEKEREPGSPPAAPSSRIQNLVNRARGLRGPIGQPAQKPGPDGVELADVQGCRAADLNR